MTHTLAIHQEGEYWKIAVLHLHEKKPKILYLNTLGINENPLEALKAIPQDKNLKNGHFDDLSTSFSGFLDKYILSARREKPYQVVTAIDAENWVLRKLELEVKGWKNVLFALPFQTEDIIPFPKEQTVVIHFLEEETQTCTKVRLIVTKQELLEAHIASMNTAGIDPHFVTTTVHALKRWAQFSAPRLDTAFLVYLHKENGFVVFLHHNEIVEFKTVSFEHAGQWQRVKEYFLSLSDKPEAIPWMATGDLKLLEKENFPLHSVEPALLEYALPIGIALDALYNDKNSVQFRTDKFKPVSIKKKENKIAKFSLFFSLSSLFILGPLGHGLLHKHEQTLVPRAQSLLGKLGLPSSHENDIEKLLETLVFRKNELEKEKQFGPYFPMVTWFLDQITRAAQGIETPNLPSLTSLDYHLDSNGNPQLYIQGTSLNKEALKSIKHNLQKEKNLRIVKWKENKQNYSIVLEKL